MKIRSSTPGKDCFIDPLEKQSEKYFKKKLKIWLATSSKCFMFSNSSNFIYTSSSLLLCSSSSRMVLRTTIMDENIAGRKAKIDKAIKGDSLEQSENLSGMISEKKLKEKPQNKESITNETTNDVSKKTRKDCGTTCDIAKMVETKMSNEEKKSNSQK